MPFEELEHTADVKMRICGTGFDGLLQESGFALSRVLYGDYPEEPCTLSCEIDASGDSPEEFCVNFLSELLFLFETEYLVPMQFSLQISGLSVSGTVSGVSFNRNKHAGGIGVKGISYSGLSLTQTNTEYELIIIFDI
ncbi:MAG TPA: archease [Methanocorpusculum sp.]|nr:archease [Methanocorpusculum sp.]